MEIAERSFEEAIECGLLRDGPDACAGDAAVFRETPAPYGDTPPGGYGKRRPDDYDRALCLLPREVVDFILATQPKEWQRLAQHHGAAVREQFLKRLAVEIERRGVLDVLRQGIRDSGCKFQLAYFRPASGLNEETRRLHAANLFAVVRQLRYSEKHERSLDLVLFLNGIPIFTAELKNPLNGQDVEDAIRQYMTTRDPRDPLLAHGRCSCRAEPSAWSAVSEARSPCSSSGRRWRRSRAGTSSSAAVRAPCACPRRAPRSMSGLAFRAAPRSREHEEDRSG